MNLFDFLKGMTINKARFDFTNLEVKKTYDQYMINRFVSTSEVFLPIANEINRYPDIPSESHYLYYNSILPKRKQYFNYAPLKKKKDVSKHERECIMRYYQIGIRDCDLYLNILTKEQISKIVGLYEHGKEKKRK